MSYPSQAKYFAEKFDTEDFVLRTFTNNNVDNTWMLRQDDVVILVEEEYDRITLQLGGSSHAERRTGKVISEKVTLDFTRPQSSSVGDNNEQKRKVLENKFQDAPDDLYDAFVTVFGESTIRQDNR